MTSTSFSYRVDHEAEFEIEKSSGYQNPRPQILSMDGFTEQDAIVADPAEYRVVDLVKTLVYLEAGADGVKKIFEGNDMKHELSRFEKCSAVESGSVQKSDGWTISTNGRQL